MKIEVERVGGGDPEPLDVVTYVQRQGGETQIEIRPGEEFMRRHFVGSGWLLVKMGVKQMFGRRGAQ